MLRNLNLAIIIFSIFCFYTTTGFGQDTNHKKITIINSYSSSNEWSKSLIKDISIDLKKFSKGYEINTIFLDINKIKSLPLHSSIINKAINGNDTTDLLILIGYESYIALLKSNVFINYPNLPIILCDIKEEESKDYNFFIENGILSNSDFVVVDSIAKNNNINYLPLNDNIKANIDLIINNFKDIKNLYYISQRNYLDLSNIKRIDDYLANKYPKINFNIIKTDFINQNKLSEFKNSIQPGNSAIIISNFNKNNSQEIPNIKNNIPIFSLKYIDIKEDLDIIGGIYENINDYAYLIALSANNILTHKLVGNISKPKLRTYINANSLINYDITNDNNLIEYLNNYTITKNKYFTYFYLVFGLLIIFTLVLIYWNIIVKKKSFKLKRALKQYINRIGTNVTIYRNTPIGISTFENDGKIIDYNVEFIKAYKILSNDSRISPKTNLFNLDFTPTNLLELLKRNNNTYSTLLSNHNNSSCFIKANFRKVKLNSKNVYIVILEDLTSMKQEIINNQDIYNSLEKAFSPAKIGISLININNNNVVYNDIIKQLLGKQNINDIADLFNNLDNNNIALIKEYFENNDDNLTIKQSNLNPKTNQPLNFEIKFYKLNSILYTHSCIVYDNTDSELKKEEIITDLKIINNKIETKNNIISEMNTQIKTPLNAIIGFAELLVETSDKEEQKELLWHLDNNNETFLSLINTIIDIVNIKSDSIKINKSDININDILNNTLNAISREEISKRIIINHKENIILYTDGNLLTKVLITLIKFANNIINNNSINIKYYKDNSIIKIHLEGVTKTPISDNYYNIIKEENTVSIESDIDNELYLDLATYIIKLLSGDIQISRDQNLLSLNISLPINENENKESLALKLENVAIKQEIKPLTILIAEDNDNNFKLLKYILRKQYNIIHAKNGEEAVELYNTSIPDLILMDIKMPIMDGIEAAKVIRESSIEIPIIAVTAFTYDKDAELEMGNLFNSIISKPVNELELQKNIAKFIK